MSTIAIRDKFLSAYNAPVNGETFYIKGRDVFKNELVKKGMIINGTFYKYSDPTRNSMYVLTALRSACGAFMEDGAKLLQATGAAKDYDTAAASRMHETMCSKLWTLYADVVKYYARMPISDSAMDAVASLASGYVVNTYNTLLAFKNDYDSGIFHSASEAQRRFDSYNAMTQASIDAAPKTGVFFGNSYSDIFGNQHVYGSAHIFSGYTQGQVYMETAQNKVLAEIEQRRDISGLKENALETVRDFAGKVVSAFRKDILNLTGSEMSGLFDTDALFCPGIENRPFVESSWEDELEYIPEADFEKLKHFFEFYNMSTYSGIVKPVCKKIIGELSENGDFDSYDGKLRKIYEFFSGCTSFKKDMGFQFCLTDYICDKLDREFESLDPDSAADAVGVFADVYKKAKQNEYIPYDCLCRINAHIHSLQNKAEEEEEEEEDEDDDE